MANKRHWEITDCRIIYNDELRTFVIDEYEVANSGKGQIIGTNEQWILTDNGE